ncbi:MAG: type VI secretion system baseplate subunit TssF [Xanthomonadales bacterium]|nr:type VI secretion system baseplate subunit TssF [Xanthomonadales bacterium]
MDSRLLHHYNNELHFMREMGGEFARNFPKIAGRLGMEGLECADPYVERLLEGFAFLTARVQLKIEEEFPKFCQHLIEMIYPDYLSPLPSMTIVQLHPDCGDSDLAEGFKIKRGTTLRSGLGPLMQTACEYRTSHDVELYPLKIRSAEYIATRAALANLGIKPGRQVSAGIRIKIDTVEDISISDLKIRNLPLFLGGSGSIPLALYEQILSGVCGFSVITGSEGKRQVHPLVAENVQPFGFSENQAILNYRSRSFEGYRLLREYFAFPERFRFINFTGLQAALSCSSGESFELVVHLNSRDGNLENVVDKSHFLPFCTPAINLFPKRADRLNLNTKDQEFHLVADRSRPMDYEIHQVLSVTGYGEHADERQQFLPFYGLKNNHLSAEDAAFFTIQRKPRVLSSRQHNRGARSKYLGQEVFVSLVDAKEAPYSSKLNQIGVSTLCSNRDLPRQMPLGQKNGDFSLDINAPVDTIRCVAGPTRPVSQAVSGDYAWRLISHLSLNYLSLIDENPEEGAAALRELLQLYSNGNNINDRQINALIKIKAKPVTKRLPISGPISFGRGLEIRLTLDEAGFDAGGMYLFGSIMNEFFGKYVSVNHMIETIALREDNSEVAKWPVKTGLRPQL